VSIEILFADVYTVLDPSPEDCTIVTPLTIGDICQVDIERSAIRQADIHSLRVGRSSVCIGRICGRSFVSAVAHEDKKLRKLARTAKAVLAQPSNRKTSKTMPFTQQFITAQRQE
jgi:hypothetical protein